jgi:hypothetical protein
MNMHRTHRSRQLGVGLLVGAVVAAAVVAGVAEPTAKAATSSGWNAATPSGWNIVVGDNTNPPNSNLLFGTTCTSSWNCWAVGTGIANINNNNVQPFALIEHWDGSSWTVAVSANPPGDALSVLWDVTCVTASDCWAVGAQQVANTNAPFTLAEHWNGSAWSVVATPATFGYLTSVTCTGASDCWAVGTSVTDDGNSDPLNGFIDHWDGSSWSTASTQPSGQAHDQFNAVTCASASDCWAVGFAGPDTLENNFLPNIMPVVTGAAAFIEHWNGASWTITAAPPASGAQGTYLDGVTCVSSDQCWAVGANMGADGNPSSTLVDGWNGSSWSTVTSPDPTASGSLLTAVTCLDASACWASGAIGQGSGGGKNMDPAPIITAWNGSAWSVEPSPNVVGFGYLNDVACVDGSGCFSVGFAVLGGGNNTTVIQTLIEQLVLPAAGNQGLLVSGSDGGVFTFGDAAFSGSMGGTHLNAPVVGVAPTPDGGGYWLVAADGGVFTFGDAGYFGSMGGTHLNAPIVGMAPTPDGGGYWLVAADGGVFTLGDAGYFGSLGGTHLNAPIVGMAPTPDGGGYWLVASDGGVFSFGDAAFSGSMGGGHLTEPMVGMAPTPDGGGYWLVAADGGVFTFGDAGFYGSVPGQGITRPAAIVGVASTVDGGGYWLVGADGAVYAYGDASFMGSLVGLGLAAPITGVAARA